MEHHMIGVCPVDRHIFACIVRYEPEVVLLAFLAVVFCLCLWKFMA
jgi:hypothetical protein